MLSGRAIRVSDPPPFTYSSLTPCFHALEARRERTLEAVGGRRLLAPLTIGSMLKAWLLANSTS
jgi:hypothetical protein